MKYTNQYDSLVERFWFFINGESRMNIDYVIKESVSGHIFNKFVILFFKNHFNAASLNNFFMRVSRIRLKLSKIC